MVLGTSAKHARGSNAGYTHQGQWLPQRQVLKVNIGVLQALTQTEVMFFGIG